MISEIASIITIAKFAHKLISRLKKKKKKSRTKSKTTLRQYRQTKKEEMVKKLLANPEQAVKEMSAEYVVKNQEKIIGGIMKYVADQFF